VGKHYIIVTQEGTIRFLDKKTGNQLPSKTGEATSLDATTFFGGFLAVQNKDGSVNRNNINLHLRFPPSTDANAPTRAHLFSLTIP
jgi:hypothetical protein